MWWPHSVLFNFKNIRLIFCSRWHFWVNILFAWIGLLLLLRLIKLPDFHESIQDIKLAWKEAGFEPISFRFWGATSSSIWEIFYQMPLTHSKRFCVKPQTWLNWHKIRHEKARKYDRSVQTSVITEIFLSSYVVKNVATFAVIVVVVIVVVVVVAAM